MRRAFTLAELIVTLAILGIVAAVTGPAIARLGRETNPAVAASAWLNVMRSARASALETSAPVTLTLDPATGHWWASQLTAGESRPLGEGGLLLGAGAAISANSPRPQWVFAPTGGAAGDSVVAHERDGSQRVLSADPWTGEPRADPR